MAEKCEEENGNGNHGQLTIDDIDVKKRTTTACILALV